ncbi:hypothetical protein QR680_010377 [Steinernema hermaphroditum]|uniref:Uncharacterized protein n=1 Tax=Steinernema hermaphroditum TaxID=289476 RepID=A0AA39MBF7_9BILA|nr:hypothetical protein QR680_010377 [Steinernema hermaphroditum]
MHLQGRRFGCSEEYGKNLKTCFVVFEDALCDPRKLIICQLFFCYFNDSIDLGLKASENHIRNWPLADRQKSQTLQGPQLEGVDDNVNCFTLKQ